jgi:solute carrier family 50 protein (sugar transporter)
MSEEDDLVGEIFGWVGTAISICFFIAPIVPFSKLIKEEIEWKDIPGVLLICSLLNCVLWLNYGLLLNRFIVYFSNGVGGAITLIFITIYLIHVSNKKFGFAILYTLILIAVLTGLDLLFFKLVPYDWTGKIVLVFNVLMYAAPGEKILIVFRSWNYNLIPIWSTFAGIACSTCWFIYGIYLIDWYIMIPNVLGILFSIFQIFVFFIFKNKKKKFKRENKENDDDEAEV